MADDLGSDTRDLLDLGQPHPAEHGLNPDERESGIRRFGRRCLISGLSIFALTVIMSLAAAIAADPGLFDGEAGRLFGFLGIFTLGSLGTILTAFGGAERLQRPQRAACRLALTESRRANQKADIVIGLVSAVPGRLSILEGTIAKVPGYTEGVIHGVQLRSDALGTEHDGPR